MNSARSTVWLALRLISTRRKRQLVCICLLMIVTSLMEGLSVVSVVPLMDFLLGSRGEGLPIADSLAASIAVDLDLNYEVTVAGCFVVANIASSTFVVVTDFIFGMYSSVVGRDIAERVMYVFERQKYPDDIDVDVALTQSLMTYDLTKVVAVIRLLLQLAANTATVVVVVSTISLVDLRASALILFGTGLIYAIVSMRCRKQINKWSSESSRLQKEQLSRISDMTRNYRAFYLANKLSSIRLKAVDTEYKVRRAVTMSIFFGTFPRQIVYTGSLSLIAIVAVVMYMRGGSSEIVGIGAIAVGSQKLIPNIQNQYQNWVAIISANASVKRMCNWISLNENTRSKKHPQLGISCSRDHVRTPRIELSKVSLDAGGVNLSYDDIVIESRERVVILGVSGSGKSSLVALLATLRKPESGNVYYNGTTVEQMSEREILRLRESIGFFSNKETILDGTIEFNITLGSTPVCRERLAKAIYASCTDELLDEGRLNLDTQVKDIGFQLSAGQRQRILLARALYKQLDLIFLDEPTSALNESLSKEVLTRITGLYSDSSIVAVVHDEDLSVLFDKIYRLEKQ